MSSLFELLFRLILDNKSADRENVFFNLFVILYRLILNNRI